MVRKRGTSGGVSPAAVKVPEKEPAQTYTSTNGPGTEARGLFREERVAAIPLTRLPLDLIVENEFNPNEQNESTFKGLRSDIAEDGFDEPPQVVPMWGDPKIRESWSMTCPPNPDPEALAKAAPAFYRLVGGQWRCRALRADGYTHVDCVVKLGWDEVKFQIKTTRRNLQRGELNTEKFTAQVNELITSYGQKVDDLPELMGFESTHDFLAHYKKEEDEQREQQTRLEKLAQETEEKLATIDNIELILTELLKRYGDTLPNDFAHFFFNRKWHLMVRLDGDAKKAIDRMVKYFKAEKKEIIELQEKGFPITGASSINEFITSALNREVERLVVAKERAKASVAPPDESKS